MPRGQGQTIEGISNWLHTREPMASSRQRWADDQDLLETLKNIKNYHNAIPMAESLALEKIGSTNLILASGMYLRPYGIAVGQKFYLSYNKESECFRLSRIKDLYEQEDLKGRTGLFLGDKLFADIVIESKSLNKILAQMDQEFDKKTFFKGRVKLKRWEDISDDEKITRARLTQMLEDSA